MVGINSPILNSRRQSSLRKYSIQLLALLLLVVLCFELYIGNNMFYHSISAKNTTSLDDIRQIVRKSVFSYVSMLTKQEIVSTKLVNNAALRKDIVQPLPAPMRKRIVVTGGGGFIGSHLVDRLMTMGHYVTVLDNFYTGSRKNLEQWMDHPNFNILSHDIVEPIMLEVDEIYHMACPSSPKQYQMNPIKTIKTNIRGTINILGLAKRTSARVLIASTGDIYGNAEVSPQPESYWGHVDPIGPRACYEEGKRVAETITYAFQQQSNVEVRVARIFNTFGRRMHPNDGRVFSTFITKALQGKDIPVIGDGLNKRSFQYVDDTVDGLIKLMASNYSQPMNLGYPESLTIKQYAELIVALTASNSTIRYISQDASIPGTSYRSADDRTPDIRLAIDELHWYPKTSLLDGLKTTIAYFQQLLVDDPSAAGSD